ncbi:MAG: response regulator [Desulfobacteraceae bacterium]|nr:MAG: response regulator [Desulfobacteraceae bacterium]
MISETIVLQSAGSLAVAVLALLMAFLQAMFFFRKPQFQWFGWSAAVSFSGMLYAMGIFFEYNASPGPWNRFGGRMEYAAVIFLIHSLYGFTFAYLGINGKRYHMIAGIFHALVLISLWSGNYLLSDSFAEREFLGLSKPFVETELGPLGPVFVFYAILSTCGAIALWLRHKVRKLRYRRPYLIGVVFWVLLGTHDGLASLGWIPAFQYVMEYGFFAYSIVVIWVVFSSFVDISAEDKYRVITEFANDGILVIQGGKIVFANPASSEIIGRQIMNSSASDFLELIVDQDRTKFQEYYSRLRHSGDGPGSFTIRLERTSHEERIVEIRANIVHYRNRPAILGVMRDVTERIREEQALAESKERLARLKKMESMGLLAGGVAHDLNNILSGIVCYPELILLDLPEGSELIEPVKTMQESGLRAVAVVQDLLTVARGVAIPKKPINLNDLVREHVKTPEHRQLLDNHPSVTIECDLDERLLNIKGSRLHVLKTIMNLVTNACEAIVSEGRVVIRTSNRYIDRPMKGYDRVNIGEYAVLSVADNGPGISSDDLDRIFEPFYTKKKMGRSGTGLGLAVVWNVIQDHDAYIDVKSDAGGTEFTLYFPVTRDEIQDKSSPVSLEDLYGNGETILVIDDEKRQREISCRMLDKLRYKTKAVSSGEEAVSYLKDHTADLLLLDMIMDPGIDGHMTYEQIKKIRPEQKAVIVSGFAETEQVKETLRLGAGRFLKKPLILEDLGVAVKKELGGC